MKNRTMAGKLERARAQAREAAAIELTKPHYLMQPPKRELRAMVPVTMEAIWEQQLRSSLWQRKPQGLRASRAGDIELTAVRCLRWQVSAWLRAH